MFGNKTVAELASKAIVVRGWGGNGVAPGGSLRWGGAREHQSKNLLFTRYSVFAYFQSMPVIMRARLTQILRADSPG